MVLTCWIAPYNNTLKCVPAKKRPPLDVLVARPLAKALFHYIRINMKTITFLSSLIFSISAFSANLISYKSQEKGSVSYEVLTGKSIAAIFYDEDDKMFRITLSNGRYEEFNIVSNEDSKVLIKKLLDPNDNSLIEVIEK